MPALGRLRSSASLAAVHSTSRLCFIFRILLRQDLVAHSAWLSEQHTRFGNDVSLLACLEAQPVGCSGDGFTCLLKELHLAAHARYSAGDCAGLDCFSVNGFEGARQCMLRLVEDVRSGRVLTGFSDQIMEQVCVCVLSGLLQAMNLLAWCLLRPLASTARS